MNFYSCVVIAISVCYVNCNFDMGTCRMSLSCGGSDIVQEGGEGESAIASLKGAKGDTGEPGNQGFPGKTGMKGEPGESCDCSFQDDMQRQIDELKEQMREIKKTDTFSNESLPKDCKEVTSRGQASGVYTINTTKDGEELWMEVYCDTETDGGGWIVFQRREDGSVDFQQEWDEYKEGFGNLSGEFWLGLENIYTLMQEGDYELRVDLADFENETRYAKYSSFSVASEDLDYQATFSGYFGNAGDPMWQVQGVPFSTTDEDNDRAVENCARLFKGAWWYITCHEANPNGLYLRGAHESYADGIEWKQWHGYYYSLKFTEMKMRKVE